MTFLPIRACAIATNDALLSPFIAIHIFGALRVLGSTPGGVEFSGQSKLSRIQGHLAEQ